jgi:hypothetical protein
MERDQKRGGEMSTHVENEFGKDRKNCLWVVSCNETIRVAKRSRVSCKQGRRKGEWSKASGEERKVLLGKGDLALWSSSCERRKPGEKHLVAW